MKSHLFIRGAARSKLPLIAAAGLAAAATMAGAVSASARTAPAPHQEHFSIMAAPAATGPSAVIATGTFIAGGTATGDLANGGTDVVTLPDGTFKITAGQAAGSGSSSVVTCLATADTSGVYKIHGGTGRYAHMSGSGKFSYSSMSVSAHKNGHCGVAIAAEVTINLQGTVKI